MTWTYVGPATNDKDRIRFEIGDTISTRPLLTDEEISYTLTIESSILGAAAKCCEAIAMKYAGDASKEIGKLRIWAQDRAENYSKKAKELRKKAMGYNLPYVGGISQAEALADKADLNRVQPLFEKNMWGDDDVNGV